MKTTAVNRLAAGMVQITHFDENGRPVGRVDLDCSNAHDNQDNSAVLNKLDALVATVESIKGSCNEHEATSKAPDDHDNSAALETLNTLVGAVQNCTLTASKLVKQQEILMSVVCGVIPKDVAILGDVEYPNVRFDSTHAAAGLIVDDKGGSVTQMTMDRSWERCVYTKEGFTSGRKYWSFKIIRKGSSCLRFGISDGTVSVTKEDCPGYKEDSGFSVNVYDGHTWCRNKYLCLPSNAAELVKKATRIGFLLDMDEKTVTFYADGEAAGTMGADVLTAGKYCPVVTFYEKDQKVQVEDVPYPLVSTGTK